MLVLPRAGLVILENPKTGTQSLRAMLEGEAVALEPRHAPVGGWRRRAAALAAQYGPLETVAVVREPLDRLRSWHRYRRRDGVPDPERSTAGMTFEDYLLAVLAPDPLPHARVGRQDLFTGWDGRRAQVDRLYDFARLAGLVRFLSERLGVALRLPHRNRSPDGVDGGVSDAALARFRVERAGELALYAAVVETGVLVRV